MAIRNAIPRETYFQESWIPDTIFKDWLKNSDGKIVFCNFCKKKIDLTNDGESSLKRHARLPFNKDKCKKTKQNEKSSGKM